MKVSNKCVLSFVACMALASGAAAEGPDQPRSSGTATTPGAPASGAIATGKTAMNQGESAQDMTLTRSIREKIMANKALSAQAKNITVISEGGRVTLKGSVPNAHEKAKIEEISKSTAGAQSVINQIEVVNY
ncbi:MAG: BON domain-containing protein [Bdellovibrio sp.]